eukprot:gb/GECG01012387.1/.p1 GENE.gb/GECG01012387.1/~~gb/GECG01012387.1/.p1  ORF type:complete len:421 (+),score=46.06 gb/GECG01012387.1/:1-1263(+)
MSSSSEIIASATYTAPTNIAVIKYWGKQLNCGDLNLPINSSVSVTLDQDDLHTKTTVILAKSFDKDRLWLNDTEEDIAANKRVQTVLRLIRERAAAIGQDTSRLEGHVHIVSKNTFPTAAGLASSAAGYAALAAALADVYGLAAPGEENYGLDKITDIARQGSGSASRSLFGGFVRWNKGSKPDGSDSIAVQVAKENHWPNLRVLICVVSDEKKETGSTKGMINSVKTSELLKYRAESVVPERLKALEAAYLERDFDTFGKLTMQDSNQFHACCLDTYPPVFYMNDTSRRIIQLCHKINDGYTDEESHLRVAYTFDAGPNAVLYTLDEHVPHILSVIGEHFAPPGTPQAVANHKERVGQWNSHISKPSILEEAQRVDEVPRLQCTSENRSSGGIRYIYATKAGPGPIKQPNETSLADPSA